MRSLLELILARSTTLDFGNPLALVDLFLGLFFILVFLIYVRRFPIFRVILGILFLLACSVIFFVSGFTFTSLLFGFVGGIILVTLPLIFAPEVRHYLEKLGRFPFLRILEFSESQKKTTFIQNLVEATFELAEHHLGALVVLQRRTGLGEILETGVDIDAKFGSRLLQTIFTPPSPLHDGAVIVRDGRIVAAGCFLPVSSKVKLDPPFGTRHVAGLAVTKDTDAVVLIVSEERGEVSLAENGRLKASLDRIALTKELKQLL